MLNLLQIVQTVQGELGLPQSATVVGNTDPTTVQLYNLANRALDTVRRWNRWTALMQEYNLIVNVPVQDTGTISAPSLNVITGLQSTTTAALTANPYAWAVSANSVPAAARVASVVNSTTITMDMQATEASTGLPVMFGQDTYPMPGLFDWNNNRTFWDRVNRWELLGPDSPQMDQWHRSGIVVTGPRRHFRIVGPNNDQFRIWPAPFELVTPLQFAWEYLSIAAVALNGNNLTLAQRFTNDTDTPLLDDQAVILGMKWYFWQVKGFNYADMKAEWYDYVDQLAGRDGAAPTLNLTKRVHPIFISPASVQDGFFPGPVGPNSV
jgi:hypothetical protein